MAVDTQDKRSSVLGVAAPWGAPLPDPDNTVGEADRAHLAYAYSGLAADEPEPEPEPGEAADWFAQRRRRRVAAFLRGL